MAALTHGCRTAVFPLCATIFLAACTSSAPVVPAPSPLAPVSPGAGPGAGPGAAPGAGSRPKPTLPPSPSREGAGAGYVEETSSSFAHRVLANGVDCVVFRRSGPDATLRVAFENRSFPGPVLDSALQALSLELAAAGAVGGQPDEVGAAARASGGGLSLLAGGGRMPELALDCPTGSLPALSELLASSLARPEFDPASFSAALWRLLIRNRRDQSDLESRAEALLDSEAATGAAPAGAENDGRELAALRLDDVRGYWDQALVLKRIRLCLVADTDPAALLESVERSSWAKIGAGLPGPPRAAAPAPAPPRTLPAGAPLAIPQSGHEGECVLYCSYPLRFSDSADDAALVVTQAVLAPLVRHELAASGYPPELLRFMSWTNGPNAGALDMEGGIPAGQMKDAFTRACRILAAGSCVDLRSDEGRLSRLSGNMAGYRARALTEYYSAFATAGALADRLLLLSAAGVNPLCLFRLAPEMERVETQDVQRVLATGLAQDRIRWIAVGDPGLLAPSSPAAGSQSP